jgi:spore coat protein CotH
MACRGIITGIVAVMFSACELASDHNPLFSLSTLSRLDMVTESRDLANLYANRFTDLAIPVTLGYRNSLFSGRLEAAGAGSRFFPKFSFRVNLADRPIEDLYEFNLSAQVCDRIMMHTILSVFLYEQAGFPVFRTRDVFVTMNGGNLGLYVMNERIEQAFFDARTMPVYELYKVEFGSRFSLREGNNVAETFDKEIPDDDNYGSLVEFIRALDTVRTDRIFEDFAGFLDIGQYLRYHAVSTIRTDPDSYTNNFFLYRSAPNAPFRVIPWDFDKTFFRDHDLGLYGENDIILKLLQNDSCALLYRNFMKDFLDDVFTEQRLFPMIDSLAILIREYHPLDPYLSQYDFSVEINSTKSFITQRRNTLLGLLNNGG